LKNHRILLKSEVSDENSTTELTDKDKTGQTSQKSKTDINKKDPVITSEPTKTTAKTEIKKENPIVTKASTNNKTSIVSDTTPKPEDKTISDNRLKEVALAKRHPQSYIKINDWSFFVAFNGVSMLTHLKIENTAPVSYKNIKIRVNLYASGNLVSTETKILPITLPANSKDTYLKGGIVLGGGATEMRAKSIEVLGATVN